MPSAKTPLFDTPFKSLFCPEFYRPVIKSSAKSESGGQILGVLLPRHLRHAHLLLPRSLCVQVGYQLQYSRPVPPAWIFGNQSPDPNHESIYAGGRNESALRCPGVVVTSMGEEIIIEATVRLELSGATAHGACN